ncbi:MAG: hypothetical protein EZS26_003372 [Candidatus Ordinivivax streblomastigis]|uniref:Lipoprotein n=1 Tax=Candidatus Ordinivivax streblomastigis TaxID=2540710 RepID=A0A5M8NUE8_9BACT|nr:MAG: hypothetical protein EZS26_003372 [Candidatus Ordinivivax streblomastigis]
MKRIYNIIVFALFCTFFTSCEADNESASSSQTVEGLSEATVTGAAAGDGEHTFHFYTADGNLYKGYSEVFIALTNKNGNFVEDFTVDHFLPLMSMDMSKHSIPVGKVEKVNGKPLYKTWFAFLMYTGQMGGTWALDFDYTIGKTASKITGAVLSVIDVPTGQKWIQSFNSNYYASIAYPHSYVKGKQTLSAYINRKIESTNPYLIEEGGYKIVVTPYPETIGHGTSPETATLVWNAEKGIYEGDVTFLTQGNRRLYLNILDTEGTPVAGDNGTESTLYWDITVAE